MQEDLNSFERKTARPEIDATLVEDMKKNSQNHSGTNQL